jgi:hypothetical protein
MCIVINKRIYSKRNKRTKNKENHNMTLSEDWEEACKLASMFYIEEQGKELVLIRYNTPLVDCYMVFRGKTINLPFRPHIFCCKVKKNENVFEQFSASALRWS